MNFYVFNSTQTNGPLPIIPCLQVDLSGGYYDAGDNVKFGLPMAFTTTMLSWSVLEFGKRMHSEVNRAREAVRWGADYLLKASCALPNALYVQVCAMDYCGIIIWML